MSLFVMHFRDFFIIMVTFKHVKANYTEICEKNISLCF